MPSGLRPLHPIHTPTAASARHRAPPTLCALCTYGARRALCTSVASPPRWQRHRRLGRGHLRRAVLRRAVGGSRGPERGSTSHTDAALEATVAAWRAGAAAAAAVAAAAEAEGAAAAAAAAEAAAAAAGAAHAAAHQARLPAQGCSPSGGALSLRGPERREPLPRGCPSVKRALWRGALWWLPNDARSLFGPPGAGKCMVVVVNGLLSNGRLPHAYYYKRPAL